MKKWWILKGIKIAACVALAIVVFGWVVMKLWNGLMPDIFGLSAISFYQAIGLVVLAKIFFGFHGGGGHCRCCKAGPGVWRKRWEQKLAAMSPEEREKMKQRCGGWFGYTSSDKETTTKES